MKAARLFTFVAACFLLILIHRRSYAQQSASNPLSACGPTSADFAVSKADDTPIQSQVPPGKALVYIIESMPHYPFVTEKVNIGLDGVWLGAADADTHTSFTVDPGVHHLCAVYQGHAEGLDDEGKTLLLRLNAQGGQTYYISYHALFLKDSPGIAFFNRVDEDEGQYLVQSTSLAISKSKK